MLGNKGRSYLQVRLCGRTQRIRFFRWGDLVACAAFSPPATLQAFSADSDQ